jgi:EmrB/QacA subfamily drug resistance transporter
VIEPEPRARGGILATVAMAAILAPLNSTMIAVAQPSIIREFNSSVGAVGWLVTSYLLALAVVQPIAGKLGDRYGRRPFVLGGLLAFGLASLGAAIAQSLATLIIFRVIQAMSGAVVFPNGAGLIRDHVPASRRAAAFGIVGATLALAAALGPPLGGLLIAAGGWRSIFHVNIPIIAAGLVLAWQSVPRQVARQADPRPFDVIGSVLLTIVLVGIAGLVVESRHATSAVVPILIGLMLAGVALLFLRWELKHPDPVVQPRTFGRRGFAAASAGIAASNLGFYTLMIATPLLLGRAHQSSSLRAGLILAVLSIPMVALSPVGGRLADRLGRRAPSVAGCGLLAAGLAPLAIDPGLGFPGLFVSLALAGGGVGLSSAGLQTSAIEAVPPEQAGVAAGLFSTCRYLGGFAGSIALARLLDSGQGLDGFRAVFVMALAGAVVSVAAACALPSRGKHDVVF